MMKAEPKKKSTTGYAVSSDILEKWKEIGPYSVEMIQQSLQEKSNQLDGESAPLDYETLEVGQAKAQP